MRKTEVDEFVKQETLVLELEQKLEDTRTEVKRLILQLAEARSSMRKMIRERTYKPFGDRK